MTKGIEVSNSGKIRMRKEKKIYKYLGILGVNTIRKAEIKEKNEKKNTSGERENQNIAKVLNQPNIYAVLAVIDLFFYF